VPGHPRGQPYIEGNVTALDRATPGTKYSLIASHHRGLGQAKNLQMMTSMIEIASQDIRYSNIYKLRGTEAEINIGEVLREGKTFKKSLNSGLFVYTIWKPMEKI
jgi:hypothetical protein